MSDLKASKTKGSKDNSKTNVRVVPALRSTRSVDAVLQLVHAKAQLEYR